MYNNMFIYIYNLTVTFSREEIFLEIIVFGLEKKVWS